MKMASFATGILRPFFVVQASRGTVNSLNFMSPLSWVTTYLFATSTGPFPTGHLHSLEKRCCASCIHSP